MIVLTTISGADVAVWAATIVDATEVFDGEQFAHTVLHARTHDHAHHEYPVRERAADIAKRVNDAVRTLRAT